jgi:hypothetical protein
LPRGHVTTGQPCHASHLARLPIPATVQTPALCATNKKMRVKLLGLILITVGHLSYGQIDFKSRLENFTVTVPVQPSEKLDTVDTEFGQLPRYLMMAQTVDHGKNLMYTVEILDLTKSENEITIDNLKSHFIKRKASGKLIHTLVKERKINEPTMPYEIELIFADQHGFDLNFVRLFKKGSKFFSVETYQIIGSFKVGTKPTKLTQDYFESFKLLN